MNDEWDWRLRGACCDEDPELFHPVGTKGPAAAQIEEAKTVCGRCPVRQECLDWALANGVSDGVFGGMSEAERRALRRRNSRPTRRPKRAADGLKPPVVRAGCGSNAGRRSHTRHGERACASCRAVRNRADARRAEAAS